MAALAKAQRSAAPTLGVMVPSHFSWGRVFHPIFKKLFPFFKGGIFWGLKFIIIRNAQKMNLNE
jgi:hypothetical protein